MFFLVISLIKKQVTMTVFQRKYFEKAKYIFVDMDGTLIDTDRANNEAYQNAIFRVTGQHYKMLNGRITRDTIHYMFPDDISKKIIQVKNSIFYDYLDLTEVNVALVDILLKSEKKCYLVSNCSTQRGNATLRHHHLENFMDKNMFYSGDKYIKSLAELGLDPKEGYVFENEQTQATHAIKAGINPNCIYLFNN